MPVLLLLKLKGGEKIKGRDDDQGYLKICLQQQKIKILIYF